MRPLGQITEQFFLKVFKYFVLLVMALALLAAIGAAVMGALHRAAPAPADAPAKPVAVAPVSVDAFLKDLDPSAAKAPEPAAAPASSDKAATGKARPDYRAQIQALVACAREADKAAGIESGFSEDFPERLRDDLARIADMEGKTRGLPYVDDAKRFVCAALADPKVVALRQSRGEGSMLIPSLNFHLKAWDAAQDQAEAAREAEERRVERAEAAAREREAAAAAQRMMLFTVAAGAFGAFLVLALYLIVSAVESNLRRIAEELRGLRTAPVRREDEA
jgi:predicted lipid-binding transport protein (Tim44 family)